jgi:ADP-ribose pyrophosphatase
MSDRDLRFRLLDRSTVARFRIFTAGMELRRHPHSGSLHRFVVLDCPDWVNVIARDEQGRFLFVKQWRAGLDETTWEIPGGMGNRGEDPISAGLRELREETGYAGGEARVIGVVTPNPAFQNNRCATLLVEGCKKMGPPELDAGEVLELKLFEEAEVRAMLKDGRIHHALVVAAFAHLWIGGARGS